MLARTDLLEAADSELLALARDGEPEAFGIIYERHVAAARQLAYQISATPRLADDVVAEAFGRMQEAIARGGGPSSAVRAYVLTAVRRVSYERLHGTRGQRPADGATLPDPDQLLVDPAFAGLETALIARAYQSLPERSRAVLWHTEIEHDAPADVAPLLGLTRNGLIALRRRAMDDLRQAYLQMHVSLITQPGCRPVAERLAAFDRRSLSARDAALVSEHLARCEGCQVVHRELADITATMRSVIAPLILGPAAEAYLADAGHHGPIAAAGPAGLANSAGPAGADVGVGSTGLVSPGMSADGHTAALAVPETPLPPGPDQTWRSPGARHRSLLGAPPRSPRSRRIAAAAAAGAVLATTAAVALAMTLTGNGNTPASARQPAPAPSRQAAATPSQSPVQSPSPSASPSPQPKPSPSSPQAAPPPAAAIASLTASVSASGDGSSARVTFQVANTGPAASGSVTAVIGLPAGASLSSGGTQQHSADNGSGQGTAVPLTDGWSCQPTSGGVTCSHAALAVGQQAQGMLFITFSGSGACGLPVSMTVTGGAATVAASGAIDC